MRLLYGRFDVKPVRATAPCVSLGDLLDRRGVDRVDFLKVDCEGAEYEMFRTLDAGDWRRIDRVAMEFHELHPGQRHEDLAAMFRSRGFQVAIRKPWFDYHCMKFGELWAWRNR